MNYRILPPHLHDLADQAMSFCHRHWGVSLGKILIETPINADVRYTTTLSAVMKDNYRLCIEVSSRAYWSALDAFVLDCQNRALPVLLYMAIPSEGVEGDFKSDLGRARRNGVGVIELGGSGGAIIQDALALSLTGVRPIQLSAFPAKFRQPLAEAETVFRHGSPAKGCSLVYDEIEQLTRRLAAKSVQHSYLGKYNGQPAPTFNSDTGPWAKVVRILLEHLDPKACKCPELRQPLLARLLAVTEHRNDTGHKPKNPNAVSKRDRELRTRFESSIDLLDALIKAVKPLRL